MKETAIAIIIFFISANLICGQSDTGVHFVQGLSWEQVKEKARAENKFIFVDCYASWCGPCKEMDKNVYPKEKIGNYINQHFVSIKVQMDTSKQDDNNVRQFYADAKFLMQEYKINAFPSLLFFSPEGVIVHKGVGFVDEKALVSLSKDAMDPRKQYYTLIEKYKEHNLDTTYMKDLARSANNLGDKNLAGEIANDYIDRLSEAQIYQKENIAFILEFLRTSNDRGFAMLRDHADKVFHGDSAIKPQLSKAIVEDHIYKEQMKPYETSKNGKPDWTKMKANVKKYGILGEETFNLYKPRILFKSEIEPALKKDPDWEKAYALIKKQNAGTGEEFLVGSTIVYYLNNGLGSVKSGDCNNFLGAASLYFKKYYSYLSAGPLNDWAWEVFERSSDKKVLATALIWSDSCLKLSPLPDAGYVDTYANLLYKMGRTEEAIAWEEKAVNLAPSWNKEIQENFQKMKKGNPTWKNN